MGTSEAALVRDVVRVLERWPTAGLAVAVVRDGEPTWFHAHGVSDVTARAPVTPDTVFRIGSLTKTFTAVAVMQLWEHGRVDLDAPQERLRHDIAPRPDVWAELCGWYSPVPGTVTNLFARALMGAGAEIVVDGHRPVLKPLTPVPALRKGMPLYPDDAKVPYAFRVDFSGLGMGTLPAVCTATGGGRRVHRLWLDLMAFDKRPDVRNPRRLAAGVVTAGVLTAGIARLAARSESRSARTSH